MSVWLIENAVIGGLLAVLVWGLIRVLKPAPSLRHGLWLLVLLKLVTPPVLEWPWSVELGAAPRPAVAASSVTAPTQAPATTPTRDAAAQPPREVGQRTAPAATASAPSPSPAAAPAQPVPARAAFLTGPAVQRGLWILWITGAVLALAAQLARWWRLRRSVRNARPAPAFLREEVERCAARLGMTNPGVSILEGGPTESPFVLGVLRPRVYWPASMVDGVSPARRRGLLTHELAHVRRRDYLVALVEVFALTVGWWNPLVRYVRRQMREAAELACDGWVVWAWPEDRRSYAEALIDVSSRCAPATTVAVLGIGGDPKEAFTARLSNIMLGRGPEGLSPLAVVLLLVLGGAALPAWSRGGAAEPGEDPVGSAAEAASWSELFGARFSSVDPGDGVSLALVLGDELHHVQSFGGARNGDVYPVGSLTNAFTATLLGVLEDRGALELNAPLSQYMPELAAVESARTLTLRHLAEHTSGLPYELARDESLEDVLAGLPAGRVGVEYGYSILGYALLGEVVERVAGRSLADEMTASLLAPLDMDATRLGPCPRAATPCAAAAVGASATAPDLARFVLMQLQPASMGSLPVTPARLLHFQRPDRVIRDQQRSRSMVWDQDFDAENKPYLYRSSRGPGFSAYMAFSLHHKIGLCLLGRGQVDVSRVGPGLMRAIMEEHSLTRSAMDVFFRANRGAASLEEAYDAVRDVCSAYPHDTLRNRQLAYLCLKLDRPRETVEILEGVWAGGHVRVDVAYNLACGHARLGQVDEAFEWLDRALELGFDRERHLRQDPDLASLRSDPRWATIRVRSY